MVFAHDQRQYMRWRASAVHSTSRGLMGEALEQAITAIAGSHPDLVTVVH